MSDFEENIEDYAEAFDDIREEFFAEGTTCFLLSGDGETEEFKVKRQLLAGWYLKYSEYRGFFKLRHATNDQTFQKKLKTSGYVAINGDVYKILEGDTVPPQGNKPFWQIACEFVGGKKFIPPSV